MQSRTNLPGHLHTAYDIRLTREALALMHYWHTGTSTGIQINTYFEKRFEVEA